MFNAFEVWSTLWRSGAAMMETSFRLAETLDASRHVIDSRTQTIVHAARSPLDGDYAELSRMVPEKIAALSHGAISAASNIHAVQTQMMANWQAILSVGMSGRLATAAELGTLAQRNGDILELLSTTGGKALAPVHRTATANARRLSRRPRKN